MIEAFLVEAEWFNNGYVPNLEEYLENGVTTAGSYMALVHIFFLIGQGVNKETIGMMDPYPKLFSSSGRILRLWDDLGTATVRTHGSEILCFNIYIVVMWHNVLEITDHKTFETQSYD